MGDHLKFKVSNKPSCSLSKSGGSFRKCSADSDFSSAQNVFYFHRKSSNFLTFFVFVQSRFVTSLIDSFESFRWKRQKEQISIFNPKFVHFTIYSSVVSLFRRTGLIGNGELWLVNAKVHLYRLERLSKSEYLPPMKARGKNLTQSVSYKPKNSTW